MKIQKIGKNKWILTEDFYFTYRKKTFVIVRGFKTDLLSSIIFRNETVKTDYAALIHDFCYRKNSTWNYSRKDADNFFYNNLLVFKVNKLKAFLFYSAVRHGGWRFWKK